MAAPWVSGARLRMKGKLHGQDCINVLHFATNTQINDPAALAQLLTALALAMIQCAFQNLRAAVTSDYTLNSIEVAQIYPVAGDVIEVVHTEPIVGQLTPASASFESTMVEIRTGFGGKSKRGRFFLPPVGEGATTNSLIDGAVMDEITAFLTCVAGKFIGTGATEDWRLGVLSRKLLGTPANIANFDTAFTEALNLLPSTVVAKMGSRKVGKGS